MREYAIIGVQIPRRTLLKLLLFYYAIYTWYYGFLATLNALQIQYPMQPPLLLVFFSATVAVTLLVSGLVSQRRVPFSFIYAWAVLSPLLYIGYTITTDPVVVTGLTIIAGVLFGAAVWTLTLYFVNVTTISERGRVGSTITALTLFTTPVLVAISMQHPLPVQVILSLVALLPIAIKTPAPNPDPDPRRPQLTDLWRDKRAFLVLFVPWALLCFNNATLMYTINSVLSVQFADLQVTAFTLQYLSAGFGTLLCGLVIDWVGRRSMAILSYAMLGITTCVSGLVPTPSLYLLFHIASGFGWGSLLVLFLLIVWDEVAPPHPRGIKYGLGLSIYHVTQGMGVLLAPLPFQISEAALLNAILMFVSISVLYGGPNLIPVEVKERLFYDLYLYQAKKLVK